jgi:hypothetical protein
VSVAAAATGSFRHVETTVLISADELVEVMDRARTFSLPKPGD